MTKRLERREQTAAGTIVGTASYMSPEQAEGLKVDARSDIFSFGALLYEMVTGRRAFHGETPMSTITAILRDQPAPIASDHRDVPRELERIIVRCLRKDPDRRYQTMSDVRLALEELKEDVERAPRVEPLSHGRRRRAYVWPLVGLALRVGERGLGDVEPRRRQSPRRRRSSSLLRTTAGSKAVRPCRQTAR